LLIYIIALHTKNRETNPGLQFIHEHQPYRLLNNDSGRVCVTSDQGEICKLTGVSVHLPTKSWSHTGVS